MSDARKFLESVLVWPASNDAPGWINVHVNVKNEPKPGEPVKNGGKPWVTGWPFKTVDDALSRIAWAETTDIFFNAWVCMSQQSECTQNSNKKPKAVRKAANATWLKAIWIDCDVEAGDAKHYHTMAEAFDALTAFRHKVGLPFPSMVVNSGGGLHVYWISDTPMSPDEWRPYADGLKALLLREGIKCDTGLTTDIARILRVPGTLNHKYNPPRPVELLHLGTMYDFRSALSVLHGAALTGTVANSPSPSLIPAIEPGHESSFANGPDPAFAALVGSDDLAVRVRHSNAPLDPELVFRQCGFMRHARDSAGADYDQPLWHLSVLSATFLDNGNAIAHELSSGHPDYSHAETQAMYERKLADRAERGVGWPSCAAIAGAGCTACKTCPHFAAGKSPLHLTAPVTAAVNSSGSAQQVSPWSSTAMNVSFANIPHRRTLYGHDLVRGEVTVLGSPGGVGKSSLAIGMAISIATGRELLGEKLFGSALSAILINAEDSTTEIQRRILAASLAHQVQEDELGRLYVAGANHPAVQALSLLRTNPKNVSELDAAGLTALEALLDELRPDLLVLDPLVALCSNGNINDNSSMSLVIRALKRLAIKFDCAILIVHHTRKGGEAGSAEAISGAASIVNLSRRAVMPVTLTEKEALKLSIPVAKRWRYFWLNDAKSNLAPRGSDHPLYRLHSIDLQNAELPTYPFGDNVQAITRVQLPIQNSAGGLSDGDKIRQAIMEVAERGKLIDGKRYAYSPTSSGADNTRELLPDAIAAAQAAMAPKQWSPGQIEAQVKATIKDLLKEKVLVSDAIENITPEPGRFRRRRGLRVDHSRIFNGGSDAADAKNAA